MDGFGVFEGHEMKSKTIRRWSFIHTWTSLICTVFLLLLALTGLPLIFHHEIEHLLGDAPQVREMPADTPRLNLAQLVEAAEQHRPGEVVQYFGFEDDEPNAVLTIMAKTAGTEPNSSHTFMLDARTGEALETPSANGGLMLFILRLHVDMFAGLPASCCWRSWVCCSWSRSFRGLCCTCRSCAACSSAPCARTSLPPALARPAQPDRRGYIDLGAGGRCHRSDQRLC